MLLVFVPRRLPVDMIMPVQDLTPQLRTRLSRVERAVGIFVSVATLLLLAGVGYYVYHTGQHKGWWTFKARYHTFVESGAGRAHPKAVARGDAHRGRHRRARGRRTHAARREPRAPDREEHSRVRGGRDGHRPSADARGARRRVGFGGTEVGCQYCERAGADGG